MPNERFVVRTIELEQGEHRIRHTLVTGRPGAIIVAERIGKFAEQNTPHVRSFLEGGPTLGIVGETPGKYATITLIDEEV